MSELGEHIVWQVRGTDPAQAPHYFDARLVMHDRPPVPDSTHMEAMQRYGVERFGEAKALVHSQRLAPFEETLPHRALTLVVRTHASSGAVDIFFEHFDARGESVSKFWSEGGCGTSIIVHTTKGTTLTSLPESELSSITI